MSTSAGSANSARYVDFDEYVDLKLQKTRSTIKSTDLLVALAGVAAMFLGYLLVFVVLDQWVVPGGFGIGLRWALLLTLLTGTITWLVWKVGVPYIRSVNRLYAARELERSEPGFRSSLLNLVDLRTAGREVDPAVLRTLERQAATQLQQVDVTQAVDTRPLMRTAYVLLAVIVMFCLYALISPKKISNSIWRGLLPAASVPVATRTEIIDVQPGNITVLARETVDITVDVRGVIPPTAILQYTTADKTSQDAPVELRASEGQTRFKGQLIGVLQNLTYVIRAGDAVSQEFRITVEQPPSANVDKVRSEFPAYMKLEPVEQAGGQIESWEGAKVTLAARTNIPVKSAVVQFLDEPQAAPNGEEVPMTVSGDGRQLEAKWTLAFRSDGQYSKHYRIQCKTETGKTDPAPTVYGITIRPDLPPEVALLEPTRDVEAPANAVIPLLVQARDPDFELSHVNLHVEKAGQTILKESLSDTKQPRAMLQHDLALDPLALNAGDIIEFWVEAFDNKQPRANRKNTPKLRVTIINPVSEKEAKQQLADDRKQRDQRLADAQQEQNADGRPDQPPTEDAANDPPRDPNNPKEQDRDPMPPDAGNRDKGQPADDQVDPKQGKPGEKGQPSGQGTEKGPSGNEKGTSKSANSEDKNADKATGDPKQNGSPSDGTKSRDPAGTKDKPLKADGDDDEQAIQKLFEKLNRPRDTQPGDENNSRDGTRGDTPKDGQDKPNNDSKSPNQEGASSEKSQTNPKSEGSRTPREGDPDKNPPKEDGSSEPQTPMPGEPKGDKPLAKDETTNERGPRDPKSPDNKTTSDKNGLNKTDDAQPGDDPKAGPSSKTPRPETNPADTPKPNDSATSKTDKGPKGVDANKGEVAGKPMPASDDGDLPKDAASSDKGTDNSKPGPNGKPMPPMPKDNGANDKPQGEPDPKSPREQTADTPNAIKKPGTGDEQGTGKPDNDPTAKPAPKKGDGLNRDPNEQPNTRPGDPKNNNSTPNVKDDPQSQGSNPKQPNKQPNAPKIEQQPTEPGNSPMPPRDEKRDGDPNAADEPLKGQGKKDQRADQPTAGGEAGSSKQDKQGSSGSKQSGEGDANQKRGSQQQGDPKAGQPGGQKQPGQGAKSEQGGQPKKGGSKEGTSDTKQPDGANKTNDNKAASENGASPNEKGSDDTKGNGNQPADKPVDKPEGANSKPDDKAPPGDKSQQGGEKGQPADKSGQEKGGQKDSKSDQGGKGEGQGKGDSGAGQKGEGDGQKPGQSPSDNPSGKPGKGQPGRSRTGAKGDSVAGGQPGPVPDGPDAGGPGAATSLEEAEAANLEYNRQATELILKGLQDQLERGDVDPELLEQLGWTEAEMKRFADRLDKYLQDAKSPEETPESQARRQQFEEMLKNLDLKKQGTKRSGENAPQRDVNQIESRRNNVPTQYRKAYEQFTKEASRQKPAATAKPSR